MWDAASGKELAELRGHKRLLRSAAFSPDGKRVVTASYDKTARVWDAASGRELAVLDEHVDGVRSAAFSPDGSRIITSTNSSARVSDAKRYKQLAELPDIRFVHAAWADNSKAYVLATRRGTPRRWDMFPVQPARVLYMRPRATGKQFAAISAAFAPSGGLLIADGRGIGLFSDEDLVWRKEIDQLDYFNASISSDGRLVASAGEGSIMVIRKLDTGEVVATFAGHQNAIHSVAFSADGTKLLTTSTDKTARLWAVTASDQLQVLQHSAEVTNGQFDPDGKRVVTASEDGTVTVWDVYTGDRIAERKQDGGTIYAVAFTPDGRCVVAGNGRGIVALITADLKRDCAVGKRKQVNELPYGGTKAVGVAFDPSGRMVAVTGFDAEEGGSLVTVSEVATGRPIAKWRRPGVGFAGWSSWSADSSELGVPYSDGAIYLWARPKRETWQGLIDYARQAAKPKLSKKDRERLNLLDLSLGDTTVSHR